MSDLVQELYTLARMVVAAKRERHAQGGKRSKAKGSKAKGSGAKRGVKGKKLSKADRKDGRQMAWAKTWYKGDKHDKKGPSNEYERMKLYLSDKKKTRKATPSAVGKRRGK